MIHLFKCKELNIVTDVGSGAVHIVSDEVADFIRAYSDVGDVDIKEVLKLKRADNCVTSDLAGYPNCNNEQEADKEIPKVEHSLNAIGNSHDGSVNDGSAQDAIRELIREGTLFSPDPDIQIDSPDERGAVVKALCLHVAHDCNMRCAYCFADGGGFASERSLMSEQIGKKAIDFLLDNSGERVNLEIDFFGGEPLMNFDVVKALVHHGKTREKEYGKNIRFTLTTNGLLLDPEKEEFICEHMDNVVLSLDGRKSVNDRIRKTVSGGGTYEIIAGKLLSLAAKREAAGQKYFVRGTYTKLNKDFAEDVRHMASLGFKNISVEPAVSDGGEPWALTESDLPELFAEYDRLADVMLEADAGGNPISFFHFNIDLAQGPCVYKRTSGCGAGTEYMAVTPNGDIYPCHQFAGDPEMRLGNVEDFRVGDDHSDNNIEGDCNAGDSHAENNNVADNGSGRDSTEVNGAGNDNSTTRQGIATDFAAANIYAKPACRSCWAKYYCSGGCHANALHFEGDLLKPHRISCELEKKRVEVAIGLLAARAM